MTNEEIRAIALEVANDLTLTQAITGDEIYKLCTRFLAATTEKAGMERQMTPEAKAYCEAQAHRIAELEQQRDELLAELEKERVSHAATGHAMGGKCQELFLENRELQKDAGRYRWILQQAKITDFIFAYTKSDERHVSNAIDATIAKVKPVVGSQLRDGESK